MKFFKLSHVNWEDYEPHVLSHKDDSMTAEEFAKLVDHLGNEILREVGQLIKTDSIDTRNAYIPEFVRAIRNRLIRDWGFEGVRFEHEMKVFGSSLEHLWRDSPSSENFVPKASLILFQNSYERTEDRSEEALAEKENVWKRYFGDTTE